MKVTVETYGLGGYNPKKKNGNVVSVEEIEVPDEIVSESSKELDRAAAMVEAATSAEDLKEAVAILIANAKGTSIETVEGG